MEYFPASDRAPSSVSFMPGGYSLKQMQRESDDSDRAMNGLPPNPEPMPEPRLPSFLEREAENEKRVAWMNQEPSAYQIEMMQKNAADAAQKEIDRFNASKAGQVMGLIERLKRSVLGAENNDAPRER